jgi:hypothetical protein
MSTLPASSKFNVPDLPHALIRVLTRYPATELAIAGEYGAVSSITRMAASSMRSVQRLQRVSVYLSGKYGDHTLADTWSADPWRNMLRLPSAPNRCVDDELGSITEEAGAIREAFNSGNASRHEMLARCNALRRQIDSLEAEIDAATMPESQLTISFAA